MRAAGFPLLACGSARPPRRLWAVPARTAAALPRLSSRSPPSLVPAQALDERDIWYRLGVEALRQGNFGIVEFSYQKTKSFERLAFLYLVTGQVGGCGARGGGVGWGE